MIQLFSPVKRAHLRLKSKRGVSSPVVDCFDHTCWLIIRALLGGVDVHLEASLEGQVNGACDLATHLH